MAFRGIFVMRNGVLVAKGGAEDVRDYSKRSDLPMPYIASDGMDAVCNMLTGQMVDSKSELRRSYKEAGVIEVGNEPFTPSAPSRPAVTKDDIGQAISMVKQGYKPNPSPDLPIFKPEMDVTYGS